MRTLTFALALSITLAACETQTPDDAPTEPPADVDQAEQGDQQIEPVKPATPTEIPAPDNVAAAPADAEVTPSGLASKVLTPGTGEARPAATSVVEVHYTGWTTDGKMFDSSVARGETTEFPLNRVIAGWTEGLQLMVAGEKRRIWIPEDLAYQGKPGRPAGMLVFDVELVNIVKQ